MFNDLCGIGFLPLNTALPTHCCSINAQPAVNHSPGLLLSLISLLNGALGRASHTLTLGQPTPLLGWPMFPSLLLISQQCPSSSTRSPFLVQTLFTNITFLQTISATPSWILTPNQSPGCAGSIYSQCNCMNMGHLSSDTGIFLNLILSLLKSEIEPCGSLFGTPFSLAFQTFHFLLSSTLTSHYVCKLL